MGLMRMAARTAVVAGTANTRPVATANAAAGRRIADVVNPVQF